MSFCHKPAKRQKLYLEGKYYDAAKKVDDSYLMAKARNIRANSLLAKIAIAARQSGSGGGQSNDQKKRLQ